LLKGQEVPAKAAVPRAEQARRTRQQVLDTAVELFAERGYDSTSLQMIADRMGLTKAAVYYHFHAKSDILQAISAPVVAAIGELLDRVEAVSGQRNRVRMVVGGFVDILLTQREVITILAGDPAVRDSEKLDPQRYDAIIERGIRLLFGAHPTPDQRAAFYLASGLARIVPALSDLPDPELREVLIRLAHRLFTVPGAG
jgi:AcrR family transcriptional regulator